MYNAAFALAARVHEQPTTLGKLKVLDSARGAPLRVVRASALVETGTLPRPSEGRSPLASSVDLESGPLVYVVHNWWRPNAVGDVPEVDDKRMVRRTPTRTALQPSRSPFARRQRSRSPLAHNLLQRAKCAALVEWAEHYCLANAWLPLGEKQDVYFAIDFASAEEGEATSAPLSGTAPRSSLTLALSALRSPLSAGELLAHAAAAPQHLAACQHVLVVEEVEPPAPPEWAQPEAPVVDPAVEAARAIAERDTAAMRAALQLAAFRHCSGGSRQFVVTTNFVNTARSPGEAAGMYAVRVRAPPDPISQCETAACLTVVSALCAVPSSAAGRVVDQRTLITGLVLSSG